MNKLLIGATTIALAIGGVAVAQAVTGQAAPAPMAAPHGGPGGMMRAADTNNDGAVSQAEAIAAVTKHFAAVDADKDGKITREEMKEARQKHRAEMMARWGGRGMHPGRDGHHGHHGRGGPNGPGGMMARLDTTADGKLTRAEFDAPFDRIDTNKDGIVDQAEHQAMREQIRERLMKRMAPSSAQPQAPTGQ